MANPAGANERELADAMGLFTYGPQSAVELAGFLVTGLDCGNNDQKPNQEKPIPWVMQPAIPRNMMGDLPAPGAGCDSFFVNEPMTPATAKTMPMAISNSGRMGAFSVSALGSLVEFPLLSRRRGKKLRTQQPAPKKYHGLPKAPSTVLAWRPRTPRSQPTAGTPPWLSGQLGHGTALVGSHRLPECQLDRDDANKNVQQPADSNTFAGRNNEGP